MNFLSTRFTRFITESIRTCEKSLCPLVQPVFQFLCYFSQDEFSLDPISIYTLILRFTHRGFRTDFIKKLNNFLNQKRFSSNYNWIELAKTQIFVSRSNLLGP